MVITDSLTQQIYSQAILDVGKGKWMDEDICCNTVYIIAESQKQPKCSWEGIDKETTAHPQCIMELYAPENSIDMKKEIPKWKIKP